MRSVFPDALEMLLLVQDELVDFVQVWPGGLEDASRAFELFDKGEVGKVAFRMT